jgi:hypothetical protein
MYYIFNRCKCGRDFFMAREKIYYQQTVDRDILIVVLQERLWYGAVG